MATISSLSQEATDAQGELRRFRNDFYDCLACWPDALFELMDGVSSAVTVSGLAHVTLAATARRGHGSAYAALSQGDIDADQVRDVLAAYRPSQWRPDFAVDATVWARCDAECSPGRGFYYHPSRHSAGKPIVAGWCYSWLVGLSDAADSWTAPCDARRVIVGENLNSVAVHQIRALLPRLGDLTMMPLFAFDAGYDPVQLTAGLSATGTQIVVRIKSDRVLYARPTPRKPGGHSRGRPRSHGARFACADPTTWPVPQQSLVCDHETYGRVQVQAWQRLHPKQNTYREPGGAMTIVEATIIRVQVTRLPGRRQREPKTLWLWWSGPAPSDLDLDRVWRVYLRRFDIEHVIKFAKQSLGWVVPKLRTPEQADRWTWLILAACTQLRLARPLVADHRLPWQQPMPPHKMTPGRVRAGFGHLLSRIDSPTTWPKPSRPGPGRPKGRKSTPATRHPAIKKADVKPTNERIQP